MRNKILISAAINYNPFLVVPDMLHVLMYFLVYSQLVSAWEYCYRKIKCSWCCRGVTLKLFCVSFAVCFKFSKGRNTLMSCQMNLCCLHSLRDKIRP